MSALGPHAGFILGAYAITVLVLIAVIGWIILRHRRVRAGIAALEGRGIRRRSEMPDDRISPDDQVSGKVA